MNGTLIGLLGKQGSGKDTTADILVAEYGFKRYALADPIREMALVIDPLVSGWEPGTYVHLSSMIKNFGWDRAKSDIPEVRHLLQVIGTDAVRNVIGPDTWIDLARKRLQGPLEAGQDFVITDIRYPNEAALVTDLGGTIVKLERDNPTASNVTHISESGIDSIKWDWALDNNGTLEHLADQLDRVMTGLGIGDTAGLRNLA